MCWKISEKIIIKDDGASIHRCRVGKKKNINKKKNRVIKMDYVTQAVTTIINKKNIHKCIYCDGSALQKIDELYNERINIADQVRLYKKEINLLKMNTLKVIKKKGSQDG